MFNGKLEERINSVEEQLDDVWFWVFIVGLLLGFSILKFGQSSLQISTTAPTTATSTTITLDKNAPKFQQPLEGYVRMASGFGMRTHPVTGKQQMHSGIDLNPILATDKSTQGEPIFAVADGVVESSGELGNCGNGIRINHSGGYMSIYCHASQLLVKSGQSVKSGEKIALIGSTGMSTGPHLHLGMKLNGEWTDPKKLIPLKFPPEK